MSLWQKIKARHALYTARFRKPKVRRPYRPSTRQTALAARAEAVGAKLYRRGSIWELVYTTDGRGQANYYLNLAGVESEIQALELGKLPMQGGTE